MRNLTYSFVIGLLALLLCACNQQTPRPLKIGTNVWIGYEPLYLARESGYLNQRQFKLVEFNSDFTEQNLGNENIK